MPHLVPWPVRLLRRLPHFDVGRWRVILHVFDMEPWRDQTCPSCGQSFTENPRSSFGSTSVHSECAETYVAWWYAHEEAPAIEPSDGRATWTSEVQS